MFMTYQSIPQFLFSSYEPGIHFLRNTVRPPNLAPFLRAEIKQLREANFSDDVSFFLATFKTTVQQGSNNMAAMQKI